jgi:hypothetical protein
MKNIFKKGLVVLLASLFVTSVFAQATTTTVTTAPAAKHVVVTKKHCTKMKCHKNAAGHKVCHTHCKKVHHVMPKKADEAKAATTTTKTEATK